MNFIQSIIFLSLISLGTLSFADEKPEGSLEYSMCGPNSMPTASVVPSTASKTVESVCEMFIKGEAKGRPFIEVSYRDGSNNHSVKYFVLVGSYNLKFDGRKNRKYLFAPIGVKKDGNSHAFPQMPDESVDHKSFIAVSRVSDGDGNKILQSSNNFEVILDSAMTTLGGGTQQ